MKPNSNWTSSNAWFAVYFFNSDTDNKWVKMTDNDKDGIYTCDIPKGYANMIFVRMNSEKQELSWSSKWDQTNDFKIPTSSFYYTITGDSWSNGTGTWDIGVGTNVVIAGSMNSWSTTADKFYQLDNQGIVCFINLEANTKYQLKLVIDGTWYGCNAEVTGGMTDYTFYSDNSNGNFGFTTQTAGIYKFVYKYTSGQHKLSISLNN